MLICPILSPYLGGPWSWTEYQCHNDHALVVCDHVDGGIRLSGSVFAGENVDLPYFGGPWTDYQCHSETTSKPATLSVWSTVTRPRSMWLSKFLDFDVQWEALLCVELIMATI